MALPQPKGKQLEVLDLKPEDPGILVTQSIHKQQAGFSQIEQFILPLWMIRKK